ncbi:arylsulfatase A-like enzyme [Oxalobacteraceae bacterium GrIS 2.11]
MKLRALLSTGFFLAACCSLSAQADDRPHNVILFVPDGLRAQMVRSDTAPGMAALRDAGVTFANSHSIFPTVTTANASAFATGHYLGDSGDFANTIYTAVPIEHAKNSVTPFLENDGVLGDMDAHFNGDYLNEETLLKAARNAGFNTAAIGKLGPVLMFDHTERSGALSVIVDDASGSPAGIPMQQWVLDGLTAAGLPTTPPDRNGNDKSGNASTPGTLVANVKQQQWYADLMSKVILSKFKADQKPFVAVFWSRDPDGTQHGQGDSLNQLVPGINGPTSLDAIKNADNNLQQIRQALAELGLEQNTDIIISADHGFSTISKQTKTSPSAKEHYENVPDAFLPPGFLAKDLAHSLGLALWDPDHNNELVKNNQHSSHGNGVLGKTPEQPLVVVTANGGADLIYLPAKLKNKDAHRLASDIIRALLKQDYVSGIFVNSRFGKFPGTLSLKDINIEGSAVTPAPAIIVNFKSFATGCDQPTSCAAEVANSNLQQGQGMHGSFSRADTFNFIAACGPDFKKQFVDAAPVSNADIGKTLAAILKLDVPNRGKLAGRVLTEAMTDGTMPDFVRKKLVSAPATGGLRTVLNYQQVGDTKYFDAAGFPGRTVGLEF